MRVDLATSTQPGDVIFVFEGSSEYDGEIELEDGQQLIGEGSGLTVGDTELVPVGNPPLLSIRPWGWVMTSCIGACCQLGQFE